MKVKVKFIDTKRVDQDVIVSALICLPAESKSNWGLKKELRSGDFFFGMSLTKLWGTYNVKEHMRCQLVRAIASSYEKALRALKS